MRKVTPGEELPWEEIKPLLDQLVMQMEGSSEIEFDLAGPDEPDAYGEVDNDDGQISEPEARLTPSSRSCPSLPGSFP